MWFKLYGNNFHVAGTKTDMVISGEIFRNFPKFGFKSMIIILLGDQTGV